MRQPHTVSQQSDALAPTVLNELTYPTPCLVFHTPALLATYHDIANHFSDIAVHYAMKCNPDRRILELLHKAGCRFEIASYPELEELLAIGVDASEVMFSNPVKIVEHIRDAWKAGVYRFSFDSTNEVDKLASEAPGASVLVRLRTKPANSTVPSEGKFGVDSATALQLMKYAVSKGLKPYGVAFHVGSQMEDPETWNDALAETGELLRVLQNESIQVQMVDIGGGFPAQYEEPSLPLADFAETIRRAVAAHLPYKVELAMEPGRALVGPAGVMVASVIGLAQRGDTNWVHLDVGAFNGMMEALESLNTLRFPMRDSRQSTEQTVYSVTGPSCDSQDTILHNVALSADLKVGDRVYIYTAGAYTISYASRFNGFTIPQLHMLSA